eukprot:TRINITY_DN7494_c0_g1_i2.p1 TRINITY_DN7494_c0_g1~~TRINITY_DN7494_c0_g1_i2.p1  ORF type:complete len:499 (+),score=114.55 TRINITY_DN7494_c0_g1_i2:110-1606(+)
MSRDSFFEFAIHYFGKKQSAGFILVALFAILVRYSVSLNPYSGFQKPPMHGDYEAQRHWMEITINLPLSEWYFNTTQNNLQYWGLDYPPLTAYHSWIMGKIAAWYEPGLVALQSSHGYETVTSKIFMRLTVIVSDVIFFFSAVFYFCRSFYRNKTFSEQILAFLLILLHPTFILIDHGHFQYNCVCLGLTLAAAAAIVSDRPFVASVCFCLALCFKQMALHFAPAFFFFLLGQALQLSSWPSRVLRVGWLGVVVIATMGVCFAPFLTSVESFTQVLHRMFPFARGLYEDKVANFWCATALIFRWKERFALQSTVRMSFWTTILLLLPSGLNVLRYPTKRRFLYALISSCLCFFLFSFQVHEKTILLTMTCVMCLCLEHTYLTTWLGAISIFSMYPLLQKDGLTLAYVVLQVFSGWLGFSLSEPPSPLFSRLSKVSLLGCIVLHVAEKVLPRHPRYPDIFLYLYSMYSALHFMIAFALVNYYQHLLPLNDDVDQTKKDQ